MAELVDALDLGSSAARRGGSTPSIRTTISPPGSLNIEKGALSHADWQRAGRNEG
jgi:hypothetical protein